MAAVEPSDEVYRIYGSVMHAVQYWEAALGLASWRVHLTPSADRQAESAAAARAVSKLDKAFTRTTATQARNELKVVMPADLVEEIGGLIADRNRLAHRFLREQQDGSGFRLGTIEWLGNAGHRFDSSVQALYLRFESEPDYDGEVRPHWPRVAELVSDRLLRGEPLDLAKILEEVRSDASESQDPPP